VLAGAGLGLALGTKWYAVTGVAAVLAVWASARRRDVLRPAGALVGLIALGGGFWLLRNWIETGNPLFPQPLGPFGAPRDTLREQAGFTLAHYAFDWDVWSTYLRPAFAESFGWTGAVLAVGALVAAALRPRGRVLAVLAGTVVLGAVYAVTPYSAFGPEGQPVLAAASARYGLPALLGAAVLCAWLAGTAGRARLAVESLLVYAVLDGVARGFPDLGFAKMAGGIAVVAGLAHLASRVRPRPALAAGLAAAVVLAGLVAVDGTRRRANDHAYDRFDPALAWIEHNAPEGKRIGLAGVWSTDGVSPALPAFGPRLGNDVRFVGTFREGMLRAYDGPGEFRRALDRFDLLVVGLVAPAHEVRWAQAAGWREVARSPRLALLRRPQ
jgi:hypothetical protein